MANFDMLDIIVFGGLALFVLVILWKLLIAPTYCPPGAMSKTKDFARQLLDEILKSFRCDQATFERSFQQYNGHIDIDQSSLTVTGLGLEKNIYYASLGIELSGDVWTKEKAIGLHLCQMLTLPCKVIKVDKGGYAPIGQPVYQTRVGADGKTLETRNVQERVGYCRTWYRVSPKEVYCPQDKLKKI